MKVLNVTRDDHVITIASAGETVHSTQLNLAVIFRNSCVASFMGVFYLWMFAVDCL
jgi:hypothetical protein